MKWLVQNRWFGKSTMDISRVLSSETLINPV